MESDYKNSKNKNATMKQQRGKVCFPMQCGHNKNIYAPMQACRILLFVEKVMFFFICRLPGQIVHYIALLFGKVRTYLQD